MKVTEVMSRTVITVLPDATVEQAARKMRARNIGILPVFEDAQLVGIVTDRDIVVRAVADGRNSHLTVVRDVMTPATICCYEEQTITEVAKLMTDHRLRRLAVLDGRNTLVGIVSLSDLAAKLSNERVSGHVLQKVASVA